MITYHRLLLLTTLGSALLTFCLLQGVALNPFSAEQSAPQQLQSTPLPQTTKFYAMSPPGMMTLAWQPCTASTCALSHASQHAEIGI